MKRLFPFLLLAAAAIPAAAADSARYLIAVKHGATERRVETLRNARHLMALDFVAADLTPDEVAALRQSANVRYVSPVVPRSISSAPMPPLVANAAPYQDAQVVPWGIDHIHARDVWTITRGRGVNVAILDTGIDSNHPDVGPNVAGAYDVFTKTNTAVDDNGHGTHVAGTIAALDNGIGVVGVAPEAKLWPVKVLDAAGNGSDETVMAGVDQVLAWKQQYGGNWLISMSLGSADPSTPEQEAFQRAADAGVLSIAAAGNRGTPQLDYPAGYATVLSVGATDSTDNLAQFSSWGVGLGVVAPGVKVLSSVPRGTALEPALRLDGGNWIEGFLFTGSGKGELHGMLLNCGKGLPTDFPPNIKGNIALIERGDIYFAEKARNAVAAGASAVIIYNSDPNDPLHWSLYRLDCTDPNNCVPYADDVNFPWPVVLGLKQSDGQALLQQVGQQVTAGVWADDYEYLNGTSMATPHVSGTAALLWSLQPYASSTQVRNAIVDSAHDLGGPGYDYLFGYGLLDAAAAARSMQMGPAVPPPAAPPPPKHRGVSH